MTIRVGTSGYAYKEWKPAFYPKEVPAARFLAYYASRLPVVEINATFYRFPTREAFEGWGAQVDPALDFVFTFKAPQRITHVLRLRDALDPVRTLFDGARSLGPRLGPIDFQLPPNFKKDAALLREFLGALPAGERVAMEFRHASWFDDEVYAALREKNVAVVFAESDDPALPSQPLVPTADFGYVRLRRDGYTDEELDAWSERLTRASWKDSFVFLKHELGEDAASPRTAARLLARLRRV